MTSHISKPAAEAIHPSTWFGAAVALAAVGWGANQFAPLLVLYKQDLHLSGAVLNAIFGFYALGLIPALLIGGSVSDRVGRRNVVVLGLALSATASLLLIVGGTASGWLYVGRLSAGVASGLTFGAGAAWLKELSAGAGDSAAGARRATVSMTTGFAAGPLVAGLCAQWLPRPAVTAYLPHLALLSLAFVATARTPQPGLTTATRRATELVAHISIAKHFLLIMVPFAPWVFGTAAIALAYLPPLVAEQVTGRALLFSAVTTALAAVTGILVQPFARRIHRPGQPRLLLAAMLAVLVGLGFAAWAAFELSPALVLVASGLLGLAYGLAQLAGLLEVQQIASSQSLGVAVSSYQVLTYIGFGFPLLLSLLQTGVGWTAVEAVSGLLAVAAAAAVWLLVVTRRTHRWHA